MITQKQLKEVLKYDPKTGIFVWIAGRGNRMRSGDIAGGVKTNGYIEIKIDGKPYKAHRLAWLYVYGYFPENQIDHKNRIRAANKISNLREASRQCNLRNSKIRKDNKSGVRGVTWKHANKKWQAAIRINGIDIYLGVHKDLEEAACVRLAAEQAEGWEGCDSSSPAYQYVQKLIKTGREDYNQR